MWHMSREVALSDFAICTGLLEYQGLHGYQIVLFMSFSRS